MRALSIPAFLISVALAAQAAEVAKPESVIGWTDSAPKLDSLTDETCWRNIQKITDFRPIDGEEKSDQGNSVRFLFDAHFIYLRWEISRPASSVEMNETGQGGDSVEAQFFPDKQSDDYTLFRFFKNGQIRGYSPSNGELRTLKTKTSIRQTENGWTLEARIPFSDFDSRNFFGTPNSGDAWRLCLFEKSGAPTRILAWQGLTKPGNGSIVVFNKESVQKAGGPSKITVASLLSNQAAAVKTSIEGSRQDLQGKVVLYRDGSAVNKEEFATAKPSRAEETEAAARATGVVQQVTTPLRLSRAGDYRVVVEINNTAQCIYAGSATLSLRSAEEELPKIDEEVAAFTRMVSGEEERHILKILAEYRSLNKEIEKARQRMKGSEALSEDEWASISALMKDLPSRLAHLRFEASLASLYATLPATARKSFTVGTATDSEKIYPDTRYEGALDQPVKLELAGHETGSFQLVLIPFWKDLSDVQIEVTALENAEGKSIPASAVQWHRIGYVQLESPPAWAKIKYERTIEPDVLMPPQPFTLQSGTVLPLWFDVCVPADTAAGTYRGTISITAGGETIEKPVEIRVYGFTLPPKGSLETDFWFMPSNLQKFYPGRTYNTSVYEKDAAVLEKYRISSFPIDFGLLAPKVKIWDEGNGKFSFDWSEFDPYVKIALAHGSNALWASLSCNSGWTYYLNDPETLITDRASGQARKVSDYMAETWTKLGEQDWFSRLYGQSMFQNPIYLQFLKNYAEHLKELGVADFAYYELFDEAGHMGTEKRWPAMVRHQEFLKKVAPGLKLLNFGINPTQNILGQSAVGTTDVWAPHLFQLADDKMVDAIHERQKKGEKFWFYACTQKTEPEGSGNFSPFQYYHQSYLALRIQPWMAWRYHADGFLTYSLTLYYPRSSARRISTAGPLRSGPISAIWEKASLSIRERTGPFFQACG